MHALPNITLTKLAAAFVLIGIAMPAKAADVRIIDGDTLKIGDTTYRLWGIDAPEKGQQCERQGNYYDCGAYARLALTAFVGDTTPICESKNKDRYGRSVAQCLVNGIDLGDWLVNNGFALDYPAFSKGYYRAIQDMAESNARGIWQGDFTMPWEWREKRR